MGASSPSLSIASFQATSVGTYSVIVANGAGAASASTQLELGAPPVVVRPPSNQIVEPGGTASFSVLASGTGSLGYRWQRSFGAGVWEPVDGANTASLSLAGVQLADASSFRAIVTNAFGSVTSAPALLSDGVDTSSRKKLDNAVQAALKAEAIIYAVGVGDNFFVF